MTRPRIALTVALAAAVLVAGWFAYWALARENTTQRYKVNTNNQQYQAGLVSQERDRVTGYDDAVPAQQMQIKATFCQIYPNLTPPPADLQLAHERICEEIK